MWGVIWTTFRVNQKELRLKELIFRKGVDYKLKSKEKKNHPVMRSSVLASKLTKEKQSALLNSVPR